MAVGQERDRDQPERFVSADDGAADGIAQAVPQEPAIIGRDARSLESRSADGRQAAQDGRQDATGSVVLDVDRAVQPGDRREASFARRPRRGR